MRKKVLRACLSGSLTSFLRQENMDTKDKVKQLFSESIKAKEDFLKIDKNLEDIAKASEAIIESLKGGGKVIVFGNGGSAADSQHLAAELLVRFEKERDPLPAIALSTNSSTLTACANDYDFKNVFSRQVEALGAKGDVAIAISTSGSSPNVLEGAKAAKKKNIPVIALTGRDGGVLKGSSDITILVKESNTARIQEVHILVIHAICKIVEDALAG